MTTYDLEVSPALKLGFPAILFFMLLVGAAVAAQVVREDPSSVPFFLIWFGVLAFVLYQVLSVPLHIDDDGHGNLAFRSATRIRNVKTSEIRSIQPLNGQFGLFRLVHDRGRIVFLAQFTGFHRLVSKLVAENPGMTVKGC